MKPIFLALTAAVCVAGCAHQAKHFNAPDSTKVTESAQKLATKVTQARATASRAKTAVDAAATSSDRETAIIHEIAPRLDRLLRVSPVDLRPEIDAVKGQVTALEAAHGETVTHVAAAKTEHTALAVQLTEATAAKEELSKYGPEYVAEVESATEERNKDQIKWAADSKALMWYRLHWWGAWIVAGLGVAACGFLAFLKFTGRLGAALTRAAVLTLAAALLTSCAPTVLISHENGEVTVPPADWHRPRPTNP